MKIYFRLAGKKFHNKNFEFLPQQHKEYSFALKSAKKLLEENQYQIINIEKISMIKTLKK
ncbi:hypothetical protein [Metamycoplasma hyosynoviae]|uniref:hypothetical protein n=1 Tax=Metamycoplasma hyosynoviae TaxID=29559 RepID=UPI0004618AED|nr:hypothetical protein [Metamycoplasma hyosynoviae]KDE43057.1 hypothetical protein NPL1_01920 [Metamycoplasma hyosynoviae]MDC8900474.1 hypothetical protein [Metamycoplasma hyosynoviae]MDC8911874.1 hypothetical protein [Metamycoplasma hyosynoviae]MDC8937934.1 hypothetical protein [Metamycoplasma hyosynoviae]MDD1366360.1 hypothetical protein [Metamycoplasma hyosynoviae]